MASELEKQLARRLKNLSYTTSRERITAYTGKLNSDNSYTVVDTSVPGNIFVAIDGNQGNVKSVVNKKTGADRIAHLKVYLDYGPNNGPLEVTDVAADQDFVDDSLLGHFSVATQAGDLKTDTTPNASLKNIRVRVSSGLIVYIEPGYFYIGTTEYYWPGGTLDLTAKVPASGMKAPVIIGINSATLTAVAYKGTEVVQSLPPAGSPFFYGADFVAARNAATGFDAALFGIGLLYGQTAITNQADFVDLRAEQVNGGSTSPLTTKGDLYGYSTVGARIPVGTDGQALVADSTQTLGVKWATSAAGVNKDVFAQTASVAVASTASETTLVGAGQGSVTLAAAYLTNVGRSILIRASGFLSDTGATPTLTLRFKYGTTTLCATAAISTPGTDSSVAWSLEALFTVRTTGATGTVFAQGQVVYGLVTLPMLTTATVTIDTTASTALNLTAQWSASAAGNTITCTDLMVQMADPTIAGGGSTFDLIILREEQAQNTSAGTFTSGAWRTRTLNVEAADSGGHCSLASNQFTLDAGTYRITASAPAFLVNRHQCRLQNVTDATTTLIGTSEVAGASDSVGTRSIVEGRFTIAGSKAFELQDQCQTTRATDGMGLANNFTTEVYAIVKLEKE